MDPPARWSALTGERRRSCSASLESFVAQIIPIGYVTIREAAEVIAQSRFAGVADRPEVTKLRRLGVDAADGAAIDDAVAALWKAADAGKLRVVAIGGKPRKIVRLDPEDLKEVPFLRSPRGRDFNLLRPGHRLYKQITQWFGLDLAEITIAFREKEVAKLARSVVRARRKDIKSDGVKKKVGRPERQAEVGNVIQTVIASKKWKPTESIKALTQAVNLQGKWPKPISEDTVGRALNRLYAKTQDRQFQRLPRKGRQDFA
jgi:hypothetical protein